MCTTKQSLLEGKRNRQNVMNEKQKAIREVA